MIKTARLILLTAVAGAALLHAADDSEVLARRHVDLIKVGSVDKLVADYAEDGVALTPPGLYGSGPASEEGIAAGKAEIKKLFDMLCGPKYFTAVKSMHAQFQKVNANVTIMRWKQFEGTPDEVTGEDIFITKDGKITTQWLGPGTATGKKAAAPAAKPAPKK